MMGPVIENAAGTVFAIVQGKGVSIHVRPQGGKWSVLRSRLPGDARDGLIRQIGASAWRRLVERDPA